MFNLFSYKKIILISTCFILSACNGFVTIADSNNAKGYEPIYSGFPFPYIFTASSVQWNDEYAVSAQHTPFLSDVAYRCSTGCDLVFIKRKNKGLLPKWGHSFNNEKITFFGNTPMYLTAKSEGQVLKTRFIQECESKKHNKVREFYKLTTNSSLKGMSGGPAYGEKGEVVGIILGFINKPSSPASHFKLSPELTKIDHISYILQTEIIEREWNIFKLQNKIH